MSGGRASASVDNQPVLQQVFVVRDLMTVFSSENGSIAVTKSVLESAGIPYFAKGEGLQSLFGLGVLGTGFNPLVGPVQIQVPGERQKDAVHFLEDLGGDHSDDVS